MVGHNGGFGARTGQSGERRARDLAKERLLRTNQGKGNDNIATDANQCIAIAGGQELAATGMSHRGTKAEQLAVERCNKHD